MRTHVFDNIFLAQIENLLVSVCEFVSGGGGKGGVRTAAVSTPVGPPPQTTKLSSRLRSSTEVDGREAISKLSAVQLSSEWALRCKEIFT